MGTDRPAARRYRWRADPWFAPTRAELEEGIGELRFRFEPRCAFTLDVLSVSPWLELERVELVELIGGAGPTLLERLAPAPDRLERPRRWNWLTTTPRPRVEPGQRLEVACRVVERVSALQGCSALLEGTGLLPPVSGSAVQLVEHVDQSAMSAGEWFAAAGLEPPPGLGAAPVVDDDRRDFVRAVVVVTCAQRSLRALPLQPGMPFANDVETDIATAIEQAERAWLVLQGKGYA